MTSQRIEAVPEEGGETTVERSHRGPSRRWRLVVPVLLLVVAIATYTLLPRLAELEELLKVVRQLRWWAIVLAILAQASSHIGGGYMMHQVARLTGDHLSVLHSVRLGLAASAVGLLAGGPIGYAASTLHWLGRQGFSSQGATLLGWFPALLNAGSLVALSLVSILVLLFGYGISLPWPMTVVMVVVTIALLGAFSVPVVTSPDRLAKVIAKVRRWWSRIRRRPVPESVIDEDRERIQQARRAFGRGGWRGVALGTAIRAGGDMLSLWFLFVAAGYGIRFGPLLVGFSLPQVVGRIVPGGVGLVEGGMVGLFSALGVPASTGVVVVLAYRVLSFWLPLAVGAPFAFLEQRRSGRSRRRKGRSAEA